MGKKNLKQQKPITDSKEKPIVILQRPNRNSNDDQQKEKPTPFDEKNKKQKQAKSNLKKVGEKIRNDGAKLKPPTYSSPPQLDHVDFMTSSDFCADETAHLQYINEVLKDNKTNEFFKRCIIENEHLYYGRTVLVLHCNIGLLALFVAKAGAAHVHAVDYSNAADYARRVIAAQKQYSDIIDVHKGRVRDIKLPVDKVDIIVCNWMGTVLLHESQCIELLEARDRWLKPSGIIVPDVGHIYITTMLHGNQKDTRPNYWLDVYGFRMPIMRAYALSEPTKMQVRPEQVMSSCERVWTIDMNNANVSNFGFRSKFALNPIKEGTTQAFVLYFDVEFSKAHVPVALSTSPLAPPATQWLQTVFYLDEHITLRRSQKYYGGVQLCTNAKGHCNLNNMELRVDLYDCGNCFNSSNQIYNVMAHRRWQLRSSRIEYDKTLLEQDDDY